MKTVIASLDKIIDKPIAQIIENEHDSSSSLIAYRKVMAGWYRKYAGELDQKQQITQNLLFLHPKLMVG